MPLNYTPISWKNVDPANVDQMKVFLLQLADFLNSAFSAPFLSGTLNGSALIQGSAIASNTISIGNLKPVVSINSPQVGNLSIACDNATSVFVFINWTSSTSTALTLTHLGFGVPVIVQYANSFSSALAYSITATDPGGTAYGEVLAQFSTATTGSGVTNLITPASSLTNGLRITYSGMSGGISGSGRLYFVA